MKGSRPETEGADHTEHKEEGRADRISRAGSENTLTSLLRAGGISQPCDTLTGSSADLRGGLGECIDGGWVGGIPSCSTISGIKDSPLS